MSAIIWPFLIYWMVFFVTCYVACEVGQDQFYDEVTKNVGIRVTVGSFILAALATWIRPSFDTIFTDNIAWTALQAIVWFLVFLFILEFHPWHALALSLVSMVLVSGLASMGVDSLTKPGPPPGPVRARPSNIPIRKSLTPTAPAEPAPAAK
jgi:hypothetical protein